MVYRLFEHTADIGIHVESNDLNGLFADAACGLFAIIAGNLDDIQPRRSIDIKMDGADRQYLLVDWLAELLIRFELNKWLLCSFQVQISDHGLTATAMGEKLDFSRHRLSHEVKAITYHGLDLRQTTQGWQADIIVDI